MARTMSGADRLDAMQTYLDDMPDARKREDWPRLHALAAAAQTHLAAAEFLWQVSRDPELDRRSWGRWPDAAGRP